jgi:hypothetical protein
VGVGGDRQPVPVRLVDDGAHLLEGELAGEHVGAGRHHPSAGHDLDDVGTTLGPLRDRPAQRLHAGRLATHRPAVPARGGDRRPGRDDGRSVTGARPVDDGPAAVPEVAHCRDADPEVLLLRRIDDRLELVGRELGELVQGPDTAVATEVHVRVDETGQQRGRVGDRAAVRRGERRGLDPDDDAVVDEDERAARHRPLTVEGDLSPVPAHGASHSRRP